MAVQCRKCLLNEGGDELYKSIMDYINAIPLDEKVSTDEYNRRLGICKTCDQLTNGMCALCGCFVEVRAVKVGQSCVKNYW